MIIKQLILHNFGAYASTNIFKFNSKKPIVLIGGMNGRGKTTFLEAILVSLYGANSFAFSESNYRTFGQYLKSYVNVSDGTLKSYVELEFKMDTEEDAYRIHRAWSGKKQRVNEKIYVYKNDEFDSFLTENWTMFIENILPSGLSNFFFFDGEKIAELAVESTSLQMKESIKSLLGITVLDMLAGDIKRIINRTTKNQVNNSVTKEIEALRFVRDNAQEKIDSIDGKIENLERKKQELESKLQRKNQEYAAKGGDIITRRQELFEKRTRVASEISHRSEQLVNDAASELPLVLVKDLLRNIRETAEVEQDERMLTVALKKIKQIASGYTEENNKEEESIKSFLDYVSSKSKGQEKNATFNLSDTSLVKLQVLLDEQLTNTKLAISEKQHQYNKIKEVADTLDSYLSVDIDEKEISRLYKTIKKIEQDIMDTEIKIQHQEEERKNHNGKLIVATSMFNKQVESYLKKVELNDDSDRIVRYSHMANAILTEYKIRLQKSKICMVEETMTNCYKDLASKKNLINLIHMDPVSLDLHYFDIEGKEIDKSSLSAGEKQLMVISLLWALALCAKKKLPVIIDTPLSRLDSIHREALIKTYFPKASEQTIILSTDSEIDGNYYRMMKENVGDEFTLIYNDSTKATTIKKGYFAEDKE